METNQLDLIRQALTNRGIVCDHWTDAKVVTAAKLEGLYRQNPTARQAAVAAFAATTHV